MFPSFLATFLFAFSSVSAKRAVHWLGPNNASLARISLAAVLLAIYAHTFGGGFSGVGLTWFLISGVIGFGICDTAIFLALPRLGAQLTTLLVQCIAVPIATGTEWLWLGTRLQPMQILAIAVLLAGVALALFPDAKALPPAPLSESNPSPVQAFAQSPPFPGWGALWLGILAAAGQAWGAVLSRHGQQLSLNAGEAIDGLTVTYQRILPGVAFIAAWWAWHRWRGRSHRLPMECNVNLLEPSSSQSTSQAQPQDASRAKSSSENETPATPLSGQRAKMLRGAAPWIVLNALSGPTLGVGCYQWALATTPTGVVTAITALTPLAVIPLAWWVDRERPTRRSIIGGVLAVGGAIWLRLAR